MWNQLVGHSPDLTKLIEERYDLELRDTNLLVHHVPYVTADRTVAYGVLVSELSTNGERTVRPGRHEMWLVGGIPHDHEGNVVAIMVNEPPTDFGGVLQGYRLSGKRNDQHPEDYYIKVTTYVDVLGRYARAIDQGATHHNPAPHESSPEESVFRYHDSATSRSGLSAVANKLKQGRIAIVGLGGTGSYILDLVSKTPVGEIHIFDDDVLHAHNAFRAPGAASFEELKDEPRKVDYLQRRYDPMHRHIVAHPVRITGDNLGELEGIEFVFIAIDSGPEKKAVIDQLEEWGTPFIDCGMGISRQENALRGMVRTTACQPGHYDHVPRRVSFADEGENEYDWNIQTADLNMMNAVMAVIKWKKMLGYYVDDKGEYNSTYTVARNQLISGELGE